MKKSSWIAIAIVSATLGGCFMTGPGDKPSATAPQLVKNAAGELAWSDITLFGPVPADKKATGDEICSGENLAGAWGYHPKAKGLDGKSFPAGGYLCKAKE